MLLNRGISGGGRGEGEEGGGILMIRWRRRTGEGEGGRDYFRQKKAEVCSASGIVIERDVRLVHGWVYILCV